MTTKYFAEKNKFNKNNDTPIVANYGATNEYKSYYCNWCSRRLSEIQGRSGENDAYYCDFCSIETNPDNEELRAESDITTPEGVNKVPLATTKFKEPTVGRQPVEIKGGLAELQRRGMKITSYSESNTKRKRDND